MQYTLINFTKTTFANKADWSFKISKRVYIKGREFYMDIEHNLECNNQLQTTIRSWKEGPNDTLLLPRSDTALVGSISIILFYLFISSISFANKLIT